MYDYAHGQSRFDREASRTPSARWSSKITGRSTTGTSSSSASIHPQQIEFARLNLTYTLLSKRKLLQLVQEKHVSGWDDPRMPTISGMRRRGYTPEAIRNFCDAIGVSQDQRHHRARPARALRARGSEQARAARAWPCCARCKVVIDNYPEGQVEEMDAVNNPEDAAAGTRKVPFSRVLYIEQDDFREDPPKQYFRLSPGTRGAPALRATSSRARAW